MGRKKNNLYARVAMTAMTLVMATSCMWEGTLFHHYQSLPSDGWGKQDTLVYELPMLEPDSHYGVAVDVRYTIDYPYREVGIVIRHNLTDSATWRCDTLLCPLFDKQGLPHGKGSLNFYEVETKVENHGEPFQITSDTTGGKTPTIQLLHCMSDETIVGIRDIGIKVEGKRAYPSLSEGE